MRAWLLLLAVLATSHQTVQVASTEDITRRSIASISPSNSATRPHRSSAAVTPAAKTPFFAAVAAPQSSTIAFTAKSAAVSTRSKSQEPPATTTTNVVVSRQTTTALTRIAPIPTQQQQPVAMLTALSPALMYSSSNSHRGSDSEKINSIAQNKQAHKKQNASNNNYSDVIIEIKNFEEYDGNDFVRIVHGEAAAPPSDVINSKDPAQRTEAQLKNASINQITSERSSLNQQPIYSVEPQSPRRQSDAVQVLQGATGQTRATTSSPSAKTDSAATTVSATTGTSAAPYTSAVLISTAPQSMAGFPVAGGHETIVEDHRVSSAIDPADEDEEDNEDDSGDANATYSNKEKIAEKVKPDPSTLVQIENSLLSLFNMKRPPKIDRSKIVIPETMKQLYAQIMGHELDSVNIPKPGLLTRSANTVRSFTHQDSKIDERFPQHHRFRLYFDINTIPNEEKLKAAELQLSRETISHLALHPRQASRTRYQLLVYDITRVGMRGKREPSYLLLDTKTVRLNSTESVSLDVQPAVDRWLATPKKNFGLLVEVRTMRSLKPAPHHHVRLRRSVDEPHESWQRMQPLLLTYTDDGRHKARSIRDVSTRSKRAGHRRPHRRKNNEENCRRHSLYVDFDDVGWNDWIVAPAGYDAFYCHGKCSFPLAEHLNSTNHAVVQTLVNNISPGKVPKACCVPTQLEGIAMLYLNDQRTVVLKNYQDMTVVGCGCR